VGRDDELRPRAHEVVDPLQQREQPLRRQRGLGLVEHEQAALAEPVHHQVEEALAV
jgi:hypothetical protein